MEESQTPHKVRAAKRSISTNKGEDQDNPTPVKVSQKEDIPVARETAQAKVAPTSLEKESSSILAAADGSSNASSEEVNANTVDSLLQAPKDPATPQPGVADSQASPPTGPPSTPKRSHKKKKPPKTPLPAVPPSTPLALQTGGEDGSESRPDLPSSSLLSPTTSMSSPPPGSMMSPESEAKEKKVRKRTKFDQATIDVLIR